MKTRDKQTTAIVDDVDRAKQQAKCQLDYISSVVAALYEADNNAETGCATFDGETLSADQIRDLISEHPLSVETRDAWVMVGNDPGKESTAVEFRVLLCTGGPAVMIIGELSEYCEPETAQIEYQDWGTPWTEYPMTENEIEDVLAYLRNLYFGA